jgi:hypothetical protein
MPRPTPVVPTDLQELSGPFEDWRRTRRGKLPIPESLWAAATHYPKIDRRLPSCQMTGGRQASSSQRAFGICDRHSQIRIRN